ncbi:DNA repair protein RadA [Candidatus Aquarickettsia rohweri]|uniref:DNA repair protein RadA n=1 Tax=Candidatus Aquarickettsia rohweri TaxID=2602574 RepID=A0A3S0FSY1_9RICK|nr:DNA repair protein RadA [Candidatus Aquarickettsia rohweri]RST70087.1 DNA repair protein RadA [Candidatus Aquarickettsia rohweri]
MSKNKIFTCQNCGAIFKKWQGKCSECNAWNTIIEELLDTKITKSALTKVRSDTGELGNFSNLNEVEYSLERVDTKIIEINRLLGGGLVRGSAILIAGEPGIGKSTLILELCNKLSKQEFSAVYVSGEEALSQIKLRADRLNVANKYITIANITSLEKLLLLIAKTKPSMIVIDSIQTLYFDKLDSPPGSVSQVRVCTHELIQICKKHEITLILIGHITKEGQIAGPKILEHMVDVVLSFEGENTQQFRIIRATKNRYGSTNEIALFEMESQGLREIKNPSEIFLPHEGDNIEKQGSCIFASIEGTRTILLEIQALVVPSFLATPRRATVGWDHNRLSMLIAVLNAKMNINLMNKEVYLNIVGGLRVYEPAADLAVIASLISANANISISKDTIFFGEVGLSGEVRQVNNMDNRLIEASKLGFKKAIIPKMRKKFACNMEIIELKHINELKKILI